MVLLSLQPAEVLFEGKCVREKSSPHASNAAARLLKEREEKLSGTVLLIFQESEESFAGAKAVVDSGVLKGATGVHGLHVWPSLQTGVLASRVSLAPPSIYMHPGQCCTYWCIMDAQVT